MTDRPRRVDLLVDHVHGVVERVQRAYAQGPGQQPTSYGAAQIGMLRRLDPARTGDDPASWGLVLEGMPDALIGGEGADGLMVPSRSEDAAHAAICLYAMHQQSHGDPVHARGSTPGRAFGALARARAMGDQQLSASVVERIHAASSASTSQRRVSDLRTLVSLLRTERTPTITLDYGLLAKNLYTLADPKTAPRVRLAWGRDLHARPPSTSTPSSSSGEQ